MVESNLNDLYNLAREGGEYLKKGKCKKEAAYSVEIKTSVINACKCPAFVANVDTQPLFRQFPTTIAVNPL